MLPLSCVSPPSVTNNKNVVDVQTQHLVKVALAWQAWKLLDTCASIFFKGALVAGVFACLAVVVAEGPLFNKKVRIQQEAKQECIAKELQNMNSETYAVYRFCEGYAVEYAKAYANQNKN